MSDIPIRKLGGAVEATKSAASTSQVPVVAAQNERWPEVSRNHRIQSRESKSRTDGVPDSNAVSPTAASVPQRKPFVGYLNTAEGKERFPSGRFPEPRTYIIYEEARYWVRAESAEAAETKFLGPGGISAGAAIIGTRVDERWVEEEENSESS